LYIAICNKLVTLLRSHFWFKLCRKQQQW